MKTTLHKINHKSFIHKQLLQASDTNKWAYVFCYFSYGLGVHTFTQVSRGTGILFLILSFTVSLIINGFIQGVITLIQCLM